jgi:hypothetical protein
MTLMSMTFQEEFGELPRPLLSLYRRLNVSPADHDRILAACTQADGTVEWASMVQIVDLYSERGYLALPYFF